MNKGPRRFAGALCSRFRTQLLVGLALGLGVLLSVGLGVLLSVGLGVGVLLAVAVGLGLGLAGLVVRLIQVPWLARL